MKHEYVYPHMDSIHELGDPFGMGDRRLFLAPRGDKISTEQRQ